ncbi:MAG: hypothetical protein SGBAC_000505 [Bacillariaceae sp.]
MVSSLDDDHEIVSISKKPFTSVPLFLPDDVEYDPETNTISTKPNNGVSDNGASKEAPSLVLVPNAGVEMLQTMKPKNAPVSMISCVGPYRTGKSLLVSRFLENSNAFQIGPTLEGCTRGIWISTSAIKQKSTGVYKFVLDCEGMGDPLSATGADATATNDARIALACVLLSSVFVFNNTSHPDRGSLTFLRYLEIVRKRIPESKSRVKYPSFVWVFRDFFLQLPPRQDDPSKKYTLEEYVLERVMHQNHSGDDKQVVDSLLHDFADFHVLSIGYPKRKEGLPFQVEEMSMLGDVDWTEFDDTFQQDMNSVIKHCLKEAETPFALGNEKKGWNWSPRASTKLGNYAHPSVIAKWCETCVELVNSDGVIPNLPDLQHQLLKTMADEQVAKCIEEYKSGVQKFLDSSEVYNTGSAEKKEIKLEKDTNSTKLVVGVELGCIIEELKLKGVADADSLLEFSSETSTKLKAEITESISSPSILEDVMTLYESSCDGSNKTSFLSQIQQENYQRSETACESLAQRVYAPIRKTIRGDPNQVSVYDFETKVLGAAEQFFGDCARGPAMEETLLQFIKDPGDADAVFLATVQERQVLLNKALELQAKMERDIEDKRSSLANLENDLKETTERNKKEMETMKTNHEQTMAKAMAEQKKREEEQLAALENEMQFKLKEAETTLTKKEEQRLKEIQRLKEEAAKKLSKEVTTREEKLKNEQLAHEVEMERLKAEAQKKMEEEMKAAERKSMQEQEKIKKEMEEVLADAERKLQEEIDEKQDKLIEAQKTIVDKDQDNEKLLERAELAESQMCPVMCCCS